MSTDKELPLINEEINLPLDKDNTNTKKLSHYLEFTMEKENITKQTKELKEDISGLNVKVNSILNKHHNDYLSTFDEFMDSVKKDLKQKIEQMEKVEKEKRKINDIRIITSERDFFRQEVIRLNSLCQELSSKVEEMAREMKFQAGELVNLSKKWKESENANKQLIVELERNIQLNKELEFHVKMAQDNLISHQNESPENNLEKIKNSAGNLNNHPEEDDTYDHYNKAKLIHIIEKKKYELKKERARNHFVISEFNKTLKDREKLESIFIDCVEECRKDIFNRKLKENFLQNKNKSVYGGGFNSHTNIHHSPPMSEIKYDHFLPTDKKKLIEGFLMKEEVINLVKDHIFKKIDNGSIYNFKYDTDPMGLTKSSFMKTDKMFSMHNFRKKTPSSGLTYTMQIKSAKTPKINQYH